VHIEEIVSVDAQPHEWKTKRDELSGNLTCIKLVGIHMVATEGLSISANQFIPGHDIFEYKPHIHYDVDFEVQPQSRIFELDYRKEKDTVHNVFQERGYLYMELSDQGYTKLLEFLSKEKPTEKGQNAYIDLPTENTIYRTTEKTSGAPSKFEKNEHDVGTVRFSSSWNRIVVETFATPNPIIPYYEVEHHNEPQDRDNLTQLEDFAENLLDRESEDEDFRLSLEPLSNERRGRLTSSEWGEEVIRYIEQGDECLENGLLHPALTSYIHAIEWAIISFLASEHDVDLIEEEKDGGFYYFTGGNPNLLDKVKEYTDISQKMDSRLQSINSAERRWIAHHKSGNTTQSEVEGVRARLFVLLDKLFSEK